MKFLSVTWRKLKDFYFKRFTIVLVCDCKGLLTINQEDFLYTEAETYEGSKLCDFKGITNKNCNCGAKYEIEIRINRYL